MRLSWNCETGQEHYLLLLRGVNASLLTPLTTLESGKDQYIDLNVIAASELSYAIQVVFTDGRKSNPSQVVTVRIP